MDIFWQRAAHKSLRFVRLSQVCLPCLMDGCGRWTHGVEEQGEKKKVQAMNSATPWEENGGSRR